MHLQAAVALLDARATLRDMAPLVEAAADSPERFVGRKLWPAYAKWLRPVGPSAPVAAAIIAGAGVSGVAGRCYCRHHCDSGAVFVCGGCLQLSLQVHVHVQQLTVLSALMAESCGRWGLLMPSGCALWAPVHRLLQQSLQVRISGLVLRASFASSAYAFFHLFFITGVIEFCVIRPICCSKSGFCCAYPAAAAAAR